MIIESLGKVIPLAHMFSQSHLRRHKLVSFVVLSFCRLLLLCGIHRGEERERLRHQPPMGQRMEGKLQAFRKTLSCRPPAPNLVSSTEFTPLRQGVQINMWSGLKE